MIVVGYGHWLGWLERSGRLEAAAAPADRATQNLVSTYIDAMQARLAPLTVQGRIGQLGRALSAMAPDQDWTWLSRAADWLRAIARPVREKQERMQDAQTLVELGISLILLGKNVDNQSAFQRAVLHRDGLMIALLARRPLRLRSFAAIRIDQHLVRRDQEWWLSFEPSDDKIKRALTFPFPRTLTEALEVYLAEHRPALIKGRGNVAAKRPETTGLWIAKGGAMMGSSAIGVQVRARTEAAFGSPINPNLFRDCVANSVGIQDPDYVRLIVPILGHAG